MDFTELTQDDAEVLYEDLGVPAVYTPQNGAATDVHALLHYNPVDVQAAGPAARETRIKASLLRSEVPQVRRGDELSLGTAGQQVRYLVDSQESADDHVVRFWIKRAP
jgi:hypothetical protein